MWTNLGSLLKNKQKGFETKLEETQTPFVFKKVLRDIYPEASEYTEYKNIQNNTLIIKTTSPLWIEELEGKKEEILTEINKNRKIPLKKIKITLR